MSPEVDGRYAVLGAGSWGTTFAKVLADAGTDVCLWARRKEVADEIENDHLNSEYLPDVMLPARLRATHDADAALDGVTTVVLAIPAQKLRAHLEDWRDQLPRDATVVSLAKGVEMGTLKRMSEVVADAGAVDPGRIAVVSGPNLAGEIAAEQPTATVVACSDHDRAVAVQHACSTGYFKPYTNVDVIGCELGGACKNVIALACGMAAGMGYGDNTTASLITRGLAEISRLTVALGGQALTLAGLAGMGDLVATCSSPLSRNRRFGASLGKGLSVAEAEEANHGQVAEGVKSCDAIGELARRHDVDTPIVEAVSRVCAGQVSARDVGDELINRERKPE
ncbi:NAD(P)-dependent glycerol-3-phosphate dehydrogenase [Actinomycetospora endophytica]|uniref:Glycerol-3-phosphate dehydrogenase [NAD(P)+] n=1 Tax=Actinomycetospora endophytica TaxID=2291215 RepID=A0ABS8PFX1_9PSEU|nr:NAD(P)H-dependent glycerol-3-phosphate dehydrogenase [Actinomycetospora endophytica]MCD2197074.1 NAD(P)-dependent glycerol-3-phosphate dehydrogenase [Actinomycetospora endophytica]